MQLFDWPAERKSLGRDSPKDACEVGNLAAPARGGAAGLPTLRSAGGERNGRSSIGSLGSAGSAAPRIKPSYPASPHRPAALRAVPSKCAVTSSAAPSATSTNKTKSAGSRSESTWSRRSSTPSCSSCSGSRATTASGATSNSADTSCATYTGSASRPSIGTIDEEAAEVDRRDEAGRRPSVAGQDDDEEAESRAPSSPSWPGSEAEWGEDKWLAVAARYDAQRRPTTAASLKAKFPELFRSDVSVCPSYSQFQVPYWAVCRRRHERAMRLINRRLAEDIEELALLQTRALDGVRVVRCFSLGARPRPMPADPLNDRQRRRVEGLLCGRTSAWPA